MKLNKILSVAVVALFGLGMSSCVNDLNVENINPQQNTEFNQDAVFNNVYGNFGLTGLNWDSDPDTYSTDPGGGQSGLLRQLWNANELTTDEAHCVWGDAGIPEFDHNMCGDSHPMLRMFYDRAYFGITLCNFFLDETADASDEYTLRQRAEVRFLRAYTYLQITDLFGDIAWLDHISTEYAEKKSRQWMFEWIEGELKAICGDAESNEVLAEPRTNTYGRVDKAAAWLLLSRLYLNAEVYTGTARWADAKTYAQKTINSGYSLHKTGSGMYSAYQMLFMGDNNENGAQNENIFVVLQDGERTRSYGCGLFFICAMKDGALDADYPCGSSQNWGGNHARPQFVKKFFPNDDAPAGTPFDLALSAGDDRALFYTKGHTLDITDESAFASGYAYIKFLGVRSDGGATSDASGEFPDNDIPVLRLAEAYLTFAEADARMNGGTCSGEALNYVKELRSRAHANSDLGSFTLNQIIDEWSREFGWEGRRRMDLIRFGLYGGQSTYKWQWMGGVYDGAQFGTDQNIFPIPSTDRTANPNLQ